MKKSRSVERPRRPTAPKRFRSALPGGRRGATLFGFSAIGLLVILFAWSARVDATPGDEGPGESRIAGATASQAPAKAIWRASYADALAEADKQDKPALLRFTAAWCMPCRVMDAKVWPDAKVKAALAKHVIPVEIDVDEAANMEVTRRYGVNAIPTLLLVDANGEELARGNFMSAEQLVKFVQSR